MASILPVGIASLAGSNFPVNLPLEIYDLIIDLAFHLKEEIRLPQHSEYLLQRPYDPFGTMVNFAAAPSWIEKCQRGVADRQLWSTFKDGRVMIDPRNFRGLYLANQIFKQRIDSYRWRYETVLRIKLIQKEESVVYENPEPQWTRITLFVNYVSALDALKLLQHMAPKQYGLRQKPNMLLLEVKDRLAIPYRNNPDDPRIRRQRQEIHETNNFLISHAQDIGITKGIVLVALYSSTFYTVDVVNNINFSGFTLLSDETYQNLTIGIPNIPIYYMRDPALSLTVNSMPSISRAFENWIDQIVWGTLLEARGSLSS